MPLDRLPTAPSLPPAVATPPAAQSAASARRARASPCAPKAARVPRAPRPVVLRFRRAAGRRRGGPGHGSPRPSLSASARRVGGGGARAVRRRGRRRARLASRRTTASDGSAPLSRAPRASPHARAGTAAAERPRAAGANLRRREGGARAASFARDRVAGHRPATPVTATSRVRARSYWRRRSLNARICSGCPSTRRAARRTAVAAGGSPHAPAASCGHARAHAPSWPHARLARRSSAARWPRALYEAECRRACSPPRCTRALETLYSRRRSRWAATKWAGRREAVRDAAALGRRLRRRVRRAVGRARQFRRERRTS